MKHGGGELIVLSSRVRSCKRRYDLESCDEWVWVEIPSNLLIGNHFPPDTKPEIIASYFRCLENKMDSHNFRVIVLVSTGNVVCLCLIPIITLSLSEMQLTPPLVFFTLASTLILSTAIIFFKFA
jgi:hypothetical protein